MNEAGTSTPAEASPLTARRRVTRRAVLGAAAAGGAAVAASRLLGLGQALNPPVAGAPGGRPDWISPLTSERARISHLLRRTTFGATPAELERALSDGYARTVDRLLESQPEPPPDFPLQQGYRVNLADLQLWWVDHILRTSTPFAERMTLFWSGHFTSDYRKVGLQFPFIHWQNLTWREMALTDVRSMLTRVTADPAMLRYLDLATSTAASPNENYARELMELFTIGVGNYSEDDVRSAARALAGWQEPRPTGQVQATLDAKNGVVRRYPTWAAPTPGFVNPRRAYHGGPFSFMGSTRVWDTPAVLDRLAGAEALPAFIAGKVAQDFVAAGSDRSFVDRLAGGFRRSRLDVRTLMRDVFTSPEFTSAASYRALVKSPAEFMVHALKALRAPQLSKLAVVSAHDMGQVLFDPPDVGGWPNNDAWISSNTVIARVNFVTAALGRLPAPPPAAEAVGHLDLTLSAATAALLNKAGDDHARWFLALASPEFQLK